MILLTAILAGWLTGVLIARLQNRTWSLPGIRSTWLVLAAFIPQLLCVYLPATRRYIPDGWASAGLLVSQALLLNFCWYNRRTPGIWLLALGLSLNLLVMLANGGFMPISPQTANRIVSPQMMQLVTIGDRFGNGKDILLAVANTNLAWLSDRFLPPQGFAYQVAFSLGDVVIAAGAFWLMLAPAKIPNNFTNQTKRLLND